MINYPFIALLALWVLLSALLPSSRFAFSEALFAPVLNPNFIDSRFSSPGTSFSSFISTLIRPVFSKSLTFHYGRCFDIVNESNVSSLQQQLNGWNM